MERCCSRFAQVVEAGEVQSDVLAGERTWVIPGIGPIDYCPFCGADLAASMTVLEALPPIDTLPGVLRRVAEAAYFAGFEVYGPNALGLFGTTPLHVVTTWGDCNAIRILVEAGAQLDARGEQGFTPLMEAVAQGDVAAVELLVELGASPLPNDAGHTPGEFAELMGHGELASWLKLRGC